MIRGFMVLRRHRLEQASSVGFDVNDETNIIVPFPSLQILIFLKQGSEEKIKGFFCPFLPDIYISN
jgi:hypothetical protein